MEKINYSLGFVLSEEKSLVILILKEKPDWQRGKFNGIGGKIEKGETALVGFIREFHEEAGVLLPKEKVDKFCEMHFKDCIVHVFRVFDYGAFHLTKTMTNEAIYHLEVDKILGTERIIFNLNWLIPMAMETSIKNVIVIHDGVDTIG